MYDFSSSPSLQVVASRDMGGQSDAASNEDTDILSQEEGQVRSPWEDVTNSILTEEEVAGTPCWEVKEGVGPQLEHPQHRFS